MNEDNKPTHLDLFSGIGGFSLAFESVGFRTIGFSEIDPYASAVLKKHWPGVPNFGDIRNVRGITADVVTGGFPCQPFSLAGKRRGAADDRHIWPEMLRVISEARPAWVLGENVPGIIGMELDNCISDLEAIGYAVQPFVVPACAVDARHRRDRVWVLAYAKSVGGFQAAERQEQGVAVPFLGCEKSTVMANTSRTGLEERQEQPAREEREAIKRGGDIVPDAHGRQVGRASVPRGQRCLWLPEPGLGRVAHGIPNRAHRLKALGNSIVPQVAKIFAQAIHTQLTRPSACPQK